MPSFLHTYEYRPPAERCHTRHRVIRHNPESANRVMMTMTFTEVSEVASEEPGGWRLLPQGRKKPSEAECFENGGQTKRSIGLTTVRRTSVVIARLCRFARPSNRLAASLVEELL